MHRLLVALCLIALSAGATAQTRNTAGKASAQAALASVNPERIRAHVKFLASDLLEGRGTGQRGGDLAAEYIATQFALYGLKPAGDNGSFLQKVPMVGITTQPQSTAAIVSKADATRLKLGKDIVMMDESQQPVSDLTNVPVVFVGYGIEAPEFKWNDYKNVDVRGKVLLMLVNEPPSNDPRFFNGKALTYYGRWTYKFEEAARKGAVGAIIIHKDSMASYGWNVVETSWSGERSSLRGNSGQKLHMASWVSYDVANKLAGSVGSDVEKLIVQANSRGFQPVTLPVTVNAHVVSRVRPFESENVIAMLPGSDPALRDEAVLYTSHFDHLGIHPEEPGDNIYNGAIDNATGCGVLLEMARALAEASQKPRRSVLFASVTGEEQGLLGSEYLGQHPPVPAGRIALALNLDGLAPIGIPEAVEVSGAERTTFFPELERVAREFRFTLEPDSNPGAGYYYRSDHFSLARVGIPAFSVNQAAKYEGHPREWGEQYDKDYTAKHYHQPSDEYDAGWDFRGNAKMARFGIALGWAAANARQMIAWRSGDEFETARKASAAAAAGK